MCRPEGGLVGRRPCRRRGIRAIGCAAVPDPKALRGPHRPWPTGRYRPVCTARKAMPAGCRGLDGPALAVAPDQPRDLRAAPALGQIAARRLCFSSLAASTRRLQGAFDKTVDLLAPGAGKAEAAAGGHEFAHLDQRETLSMLHGDSHSPAVCPLPAAVASGSSCVGNTPPVQDHLALDNSSSCNSSSSGYILNNTAGEPNRKSRVNRILM